MQTVDYKSVRAAVLYGSEDIRIVEEWEELGPVDAPRKLPEIESKDVLIKVRACGVCGTDCHIYMGRVTRSYPLIMGHEFSGDVVAVGKEVTVFDIGDRVTSDGTLYCGKCYFCRSGLPTTICQNLKQLGHQWHGAYAEYLLLPERAVYKIPEGVDYEIAAWTEPLACVYHGNEVSGIRRGDTVFIAGAGPIGCLHVMMAKESGASKVIVSETVSARMEYAKISGADIVINPKEEDPVERVREETDGLGADVTIECAGHPTAMEQCFYAARKGGTFLVFGICGEDVYIKIRPLDINSRELKIVGSWACPYTAHQTLNVLSSGRLTEKLKKLITHRFTLDNVEQAIKMIDKKLENSMKAIIIY